jgi:hypothetical protein
LSAIHRAKHSGEEHMKSELWVFNDPPNVAAIASKGVLCGRDWIDDEDGAWQFHGSQSSRQEGDALVVSLQNIVDVGRYDSRLGRSSGRMPRLANRRPARIFRA